MDKQGVELSVNFLVMFILAIVIFFLGIGLLYVIFGEAQTVQGQTQDEIDDRLAMLRCPSQDVICVIGEREVHQKGRFVLYGLFLYNPYHDRQVTYTVTITPGVAVDGSHQTIEPPPHTDWVKMSPVDPIVVDARHQERVGVGIAIPQRGVSAGIYTYRVNVSSDMGEQFSSFIQVRVQ